MGNGWMMKPALQEQNLTSFSLRGYYRMKAVAFWWCFTRFRAGIAAVSATVYEICCLAGSSHPCLLARIILPGFLLPLRSKRSRWECPLSITQSGTILPLSLVMQECHDRYFMRAECLWNSAFLMLCTGFLNLEGEAVWIFKNPASSVWHS